MEGESLRIDKVRRGEDELAESLPGVVPWGCDPESVVGVDVPQNSDRWKWWVPRGGYWLLLQENHQAD